MSDKKIVVIGGGTGIFATLMGLKSYTNDITAVVTMADDGGSSGRLRDEFGLLPPGDIRRCLVALSPNDRIHHLLRALFEYRFDKGHGLNGHSLGNLFLAGLTEITGSLEQAIQEASRLLHVKGQVLPVTTDNVRLFAELESGTIISGEHNIDVRTEQPEIAIRRVYLSPDATVHPAAAEAIRNADILVIGPGDIYTSLVPNLLVRGVPEAIQESKGVRIYVCNLMTKAGETDGFSASDFLGAISHYLRGRNSLDCMIAHSGTFPSDMLTSYDREKAYPIITDVECCLDMVSGVFQADLAAKGTLARHDASKLARLIMQVGSMKTCIRGRTEPMDQTFPAVARRATAA